MATPSLFISYCSQNASIADEIDNAFVNNGYSPSRDIRDVAYTESFSAFMEKIRETDFALLVISDSFLRSSNCMFEVIELMKDNDFRNKVLPVVLNDANLKPAGKAEYLAFWKKQYDDLGKSTHDLPQEDKVSIAKDLRHYKTISMNIGDFIALLYDMKYIPYDELKAANFQPLFDAIKKKSRDIPKQIKILAITAAPDDDIIYEQEQNALLRAFSDYGEDKVFLDMPDPVQETLVELENWGKEFTYDIVIISAHGSKEGFLCFEDHQGKEVFVTGKQIAETLKRFKSQPQVVILSCCHSASKHAGFTMLPVAQEIFSSQTSCCVIEMNKAISQFAAIDFNKGFTQALLEGKTIAQAFDQGRETIKIEETKRLQDKARQWKFIHEDSIPEMQITDSAKGITFLDFSRERIKRERILASDFEGAKFIDREFVGRRKELREVYRRILHEKESIIILKGQGGAGKSALCTRVFSYLKAKGYELVITVGQVSVSGLIDKLFFFAEKNGCAGARTMADNANVPWKQKAAWLFKECVTKQKVALVLDNFEDNQKEPEGTIADGDLQEFLRICNDTLKHHDSVILITTRYAIPGLSLPVEIRDLKKQEARKLFFNFASLAGLEDKEINDLIKTTGANPRMLDLLEKLCKEEFGYNRISIEEIEALIREAQEIVTGDVKKEGYDFAPWFINRLVSHLDDKEKALLKAVAIFRVPVPVEALALFCDTTDIRKTREKITRLSLIFFLPPGFYGVHRLTAIHIQKTLYEEGEALRQAHAKAGEYFDQ